MSLLNPVRLGWTVAVLYFFSGVVGLAYQVLWARMLSLQFGVSIFGVVITAAAFMIGLGLGSLWGTRWASRVARPLKLFALLEVVVAIYALSLPFIMRAIDAGVVLLSPESLFVWYGLQLASALLMVALPALAMGIGFPMVLRALENTNVSLARIYGLNTCGGAMGALLPLWLLPMFGWAAGVWCVAIIGLTVAAMAWWLSTRSEDMLHSRQHSQSTDIDKTTLLAYAGVGAAALMLEIGWTRLFGMLLLRTEYVMAVILAVFLVGIGVGSLASKRLMARYWFDLLPVAAAIFALLSLWALPGLAAWAEQSQFQSLFNATLFQGLAIALLTLPVTLLLGAWLPLLSARFGADKHNGAQLYGVNSVGAAAGALAAGFIFIPWLGTTGTVVLAALLLFVSGMAWARRGVWLALPLIGLLVWPVTTLPPVAVLLPQAQANSQNLMVDEDALAITHVVKRNDGQRLLLADLQRMDASSEPLAIISQQNQTRLPLLLHPEPKQVLFLGLGTGISAAGSLAWPQLERTAVELSQGAIDATRDWFTEVNGDVATQLHIVRDDARRFLRITTQHYDVIIGDLFHPDLVGRSALLSVQQFERARLRLNNGGVFVQWLALNQFDAVSLTVVLRSFQRVFPDAVLFVDGFRLGLVGGKGWQPGIADMLGNLARLNQQGQALATGTEGPWSWLGRYWGTVEMGPGPIQDEWAPVIEFHLPKARYRGEMDLAALLEWLLARRPHVQAAMTQLTVPEAQQEAFERGYVATELALRAWLAEMQGDALQGQRLLRLAFQANPQDRWVSGTIADRMYLSLTRLSDEGVERRRALLSMLKIRPDHADALAEMWRLETEAGNQELAAGYRQRLTQISPFDQRLSMH